MEEDFLYPVSRHLKDKPARENNLASRFSHHSEKVPAPVGRVLSASATVMPISINLSMIPDVFRWNSNDKYADCEAGTILVTAQKGKFIHGPLGH
jgi:hypothetical protein